MKKMKLSIVAAGMFLTFSTFAQDVVKGRPSLQIGVNAGVPLGDFKETHKTGFGGDLKVLFPIFEGGFATLSGGLTSFPGKSELGFKIPNLKVIPVKAGVQYRFPGGFYFEPQLGYSRFSVKDEDGYGAFTYAANVGILVNKIIDLSAFYQGASKDGSTLDYFGAKAAINLGL